VIPTGTPPVQPELDLRWPGFPGPIPRMPPGQHPDTGSVAPGWLQRLRPGDLRRVARNARDGNPLVFLVDARDHWSLLEPRLPLAGFDPVDFEEAPEGDLRLVVFTDTPSRRLEHLLKCLRQTRIVRAVVCDRIAMTGPGLAALVSPADTAPKNS